jgi:hypothetical protein
VGVWAGGVAVCRRDESGGDESGGDEGQAGGAAEHDGHLTARR